jgi:hypothetical protein
MADVTHLAGRLVVAEGDPGFGSRAVPVHVETWHRAWAGEYLRIVGEGEPGPAIAYLHDLRYGTPAAYVDPWRLAAEIAAQAVAAHDAGDEPVLVPAQREDGGGDAETE